ncbi:hypothetical protein ACJX0J_009639, partial [Zea mays]
HVSYPSLLFPTRCMRASTWDKFIEKMFGIWKIETIQEKALTYQIFCLYIFFLIYVLTFQWLLSLSLFILILVFTPRINNCHFIEWMHIPNNATKIKIWISYKWVVANLSSINGEDKEDTSRLCELIDLAGEEERAKKDA